MDVEDVEVELTRVKPQPGELLVLTIKSDEVMDATITAIRERFKQAIEGLGASNRMMVFGVAPQDSVEFKTLHVKDGDLLTMTIKSEYDRSDDVPALEQRLQGALDRMGVKAGALVVEAPIGEREEVVLDIAPEHQNQYLCRFDTVKSVIFTNIKDPVQHPKGTCPSCGHKGEFRMMALQCPTHGTFGGC